MSDRTGRIEGIGRRPASPAAAGALALALGSAWVGCTPSAPPGESDSSTGAAIYRDRTCSRCHGESRTGTEMAPPLTGLGEHWSVAALSEYIADPASFRETDPRLRGLVDRYGGRLMPRIRMTEAERETLAQWLLAPATDPARGSR